MEEKVVKGNRITERGILGQLLLFFFPILFGAFLQQLYNTVGVMVVGHFVGKQVLAAVGGSTSTLINLLVGFFVELSSGVTVVISRPYGARETDKVHWAMHTFIAFSVIGGIIFMIAGLVGLPQTLEIMKTLGDVIGHTVVYIRIYFLGIIVSLIYSMGAGVLHVVRNSRWPLYFFIASCSTDIILDVLLVTVLGMGAAGTVPATITSQFLGAILVVLALMRTNDMYKLGWKKVRIDQRVLQRIVRVGIPAGVQSIVHNISNVTIRANVNTLGTNNMAAWTTHDKVDDLCWMMINILGISATTSVGQNFRAGHLDRVRRGAGICMVVGVVLIASMGVVLHSGDRLLMELFTMDQQVQAISMDLLRFMVPIFIIYIAIEILSGTLRGVRDIRMPLVIAGIDMYTVRALQTIFALPHYYTIISATFCYSLTWSLTTVASVIYYYFLSNLRR